MIRYRCPHCAALIVAHERRAGQSSVCKACVRPHAIPADQSLWLTELGEPLRPPAPSEPTVSTPVPASDPRPAVTFDTHARSVSEFELPEPARVEPPPAPLPAPVVVAVREPEPEPVAVPHMPVAASQPRFAPVATAEHDTPAPRTEPAVVTITPAPGPAYESPVGRPQPLPAAFATPAPRGSGRFVPARDSDSGYLEPVQLQTQADIAVALTAALTSQIGRAHV